MITRIRIQQSIFVQLHNTGNMYPDPALGASPRNIFSLAFWRNRFLARMTWPRGHILSNKTSYTKTTFSVNENFCVGQKMQRQNAKCLQKGWKAPITSIIENAVQYIDKNKMAPTTKNIENKTKNKWLWTDKKDKWINYLESKEKKNMKTIVLKRKVKWRRKNNQIAFE